MVEQISWGIDVSWQADCMGHQFAEIYQAFFTAKYVVDISLSLGGSVSRSHTII